MRLSFVLLVMIALLAGVFMFMSHTAPSPWR